VAKGQRDREKRKQAQERQEQALQRRAERAKEKQLAELEASIAELESRLQELSRELEAAGVSGAVARVHELGREYAEVEGQLYDRMAEWSKVTG
jgi:chromosome segregation ATPase